MGVNSFNLVNEPISVAALGGNEGGRAGATCVTTLDPSLGQP
jgi:hypothetical protein